MHFFNKKYKKEYSEVINMKKSIINKSSIIEEVKSRLIEGAISYAKKNLESSKNDIFNYVERRIKSNLENKVKQEVRRYKYLTIGLFLLTLGILLLVYGILQIIASLLILPSFIVNITYSIILILFGVYFYLAFK